MGTNASPPSLAPFGAPIPSGIRTKLTIDGSSYVYDMKIANAPDCSVPPAVIVQTPSLQAGVATLQEDKSALRIHAYSRAEVIKPGTYSRSLLRSANVQKLDCAGCNAAHSIGIDHCHKHDGDKYGKGPQKRPRRY